MKTGYVTLGRTTVVWCHLTSTNRPDYTIPTVLVPSWHPSVLYEGSVVLISDERPPSPVTGRSDEYYIYWLDAAGRTNTGWIPRTVPVRQRNTRQRLTLGSPNPSEPMSAWDQMRWRAGWPVKFRMPAVKRWLFTYGRQYLPLLRAVVREWGGVYKTGDDAIKLIRQIVGQVFHETLERVPNMGAKVSHQNEKKATDIKGAQKRAKTAKKGKRGDDVIDLTNAKKPRNKAEEKKAAKKASQSTGKKAVKESKGKTKKAARVIDPKMQSKIEKAFKRWKGGEALSSVQNDVGRSLTGPFIKLAGSKEAFVRLRGKGAGGRKFGV